MKRDIDKLADRLVKLGREGVAIETKIREWKAAQKSEPVAAGFGTDLWTCPRVADLIEQRFGVQYHVDHIGRLLHDLGWSPQKPARRALERDEEKIRRWIHEDGPRVKKTPDGAARRSSSSTKAAC